MLFYYDPRFLDHQTLDGHPERPDRLRAVTAQLERSGLLQDLQIQTPTPLLLSDLSSVHTDAHLAFVQSMSPASGLASVDPDTHLCPASLDTALHAAGAVVQATDQILAGVSKTAFCAVRPPGHHAEANDAMGFCLFNSVAAGAARALEHPDVERVAILDFDVHHGNGTVDIFRDDPRVLVCSSFQHPYYPHRMFDIDRDHLVYTPLAAGSGSNEFRAAIEADWLPKLAAHQPDVIFVSAGFDGHAADPLAQLNLATDDYTWITGLIRSAANATAQGRVISSLEGGYDLGALAESVEAHIQELL